MINCKEISINIKEELKEKLNTLNKEYNKEYNKEGSKNVPRLAIIQVGNNPASNNYVKGKCQDCLEIGIKADVYTYSEDITEEEIINLINDLNSNKNVHGIIVQLPLPKHLNEDRITNAVASEKDVDGFKKDSPYIPCTPLGVITLLDRLNVDIKGKLITLIGYGKLVNKPLFNILSDKGATVCVCRSHTRMSDKILLCSSSDIIITATGKHGVINPVHFLKANNKIINDKIIIDCGIEVINGKQYGDCSEDIYKYIDKVTPRVGGMGLMTRVGLLQNIIEAYQKTLFK